MLKTRSQPLELKAKRKPQSPTIERMSSSSRSRRRTLRIRQKSSFTFYTSKNIYLCTMTTIKTTKKTRGDNKASSSNTLHTVEQQVLFPHRHRRNSSSSNNSEQLRFLLLLLLMMMIVCCPRIVCVTLVQHSSRSAATVSQHTHTVSLQLLPLCSLSLSVCFVQIRQAKR